MSSSMKSLRLNKLIILILFIIMKISNLNALHLNGVTLVPNHPRSNVYESFFHELIEEISDVGQFSYQLRTLPEAIYGGEIGETIPQGLIGEIYENNADFIIADMEITTERKKFVQFTRPFMKSKLAVLVKKRSSKDRSSSQNNDIREILQRSKRIVIKGSMADRYFKTSRNPLVYHLIPYGIAQMDVAVNLVKSQNDYALVSDDVRLNLIAANDCELTVITADNHNNRSFGYDFQPEYAIAVGLNSPFFGYFDRSLEYLEDIGKLESIIDQHWYNRCEKQIMEAQHQNDFPDLKDSSISYNNVNSTDFIENLASVSSSASILLILLLSSSISLASLFSLLHH